MLENVNKFNVQGTVYRKYIQIYTQQDATLHTLFVSGKLLYMLRVVPPPIIRSTHNRIYSIWNLSNQVVVPTLPR